MLLQLSLEFFAALQEFPLLALVLLLDRRQLRLQLLLVHSEALNLPPQHLQKDIIARVFSNTKLVTNYLKHTFLENEGWLMTQKYLHPSCCDNAAHVWDHGLAKDVIDQAMVPHKPGPNVMRLDVT